MCHMVAIKLVPLYDHDQKHEKQMTCVSCKRKLRAGEPIKKFSRKNVDEDLRQFLDATFGKQKARS